MDTDPIVFNDHMPSSSSPLVPGGFDFLFALFPVLFVAVLIFIGFTAYRNYRAAKRGGVDPFAVDTELKVKAINSNALRGTGHPEPGARSLEQRLAEIDDLHRRGVITDAERATARTEILSGD